MIVIYRSHRKIAPVNNTECFETYGPLKAKIFGIRIPVAVALWWYRQ